MEYVSKYNSSLGEILIACNDCGLTGLWFVGQKYFAANLDDEIIEKETEIIKLTKKWLDIYFSGKVPNFKIPLYFKGTEFQKEVWEILLKIPYGKTLTYKDISNLLEKKKGIRQSAQAVGGAVSKNRIAIIVPCHRVIGSNGKIVGYAGGIDKKIELLNLEKIIVL